MNRAWKIQGHVFKHTDLARFYRTEILKMTQQEVAEYTGVKQQNVSLHESGRWLPQIHNAYVTLGLAAFAHSMSGRQADVLHQILNGSWVRDLHKNFPGLVPILMEDEEK